MENLKKLEGKSIFVLREVKKRFKNPAILWSMGKDSTALLHLCKKAFFGKIPFPVIHIDTQFKFKEIYEFREHYAKKLGLDLIVHANPEATKRGIFPEKGKLKCCTARKTEALKQIVRKKKIDALILGIRRDEHGIREKDRYFSPRDKNFKWNFAQIKTNRKGDSDVKSLQDSEFDEWGIYASNFGPGTDHVRVHPLLHWTELEIWEYTKQESIPINPLYFSKKGERFRSIGCEPCCKPIKSNASSIKEIIQELFTTKVAEREGRSQEKEDEYAMQKLRSLGYM